MAEILKKALSRRSVLGALGGVGVLGVLSYFMFGGSSRQSTIVGKIDPTTVKDIGDGYYLADGWVLSAEDLNGMELPISDADL